MTNPRLRNLAALLSFAILAVFVSSCAQPTGPAAAGDNSFGGVAVFTIPTPTAAGSISGDDIVLTWSNGYVTGSEAKTPQGEFYPTSTTADFNTSGNTLTAGSGHTDIYQLIAGVWTKIGESKTGTYTVTGAATTDGEYSFYVKEKSLSGTGRTQNTWHSLASNTVIVEVETSCVAENTYGMTLLEQGNDHGNVYLDDADATHIIASTPSGKFNMHFSLSASCDQVTINTTSIDDHSSVWLTAGDGASKEAFPEYDEYGNFVKWVANNVPCPVTMNTQMDLVITVDGTPVTGTWSITCTE
jgi:hypothetical protein